MAASKARVCKVLNTGSVVAFIAMSVLNLVIWLVKFLQQFYNAFVTVGVGVDEPCKDDLRNQVFYCFMTMTSMCIIR